MTDLATYPDVEDVLLDLLGDLVGDTGDDTHKGTSTPDDLATRLPFLLIPSPGGSDDTVTDTSRVDVHVLAGSFAQARDISKQIRARLVPGPHVYSSGGQVLAVLDRVTCSARPREVPPWTADGTIRHFLATYTVTARRTA